MVPGVRPAPRVGPVDRLLLWTGAGLAALPPLLGLTFVLLPDIWIPILLYSDPAGASAFRVLVRLLTELVMSLGSTTALAAWQLGLLGMALIVVGSLHERRTRWVVLTWSVVAVAGLVGGSGAVLDALFPVPDVTVLAVSASLGILFWTGLIALVVLALRRLRPSAPAWAVVGSALVAAVLLGTTYLMVISGARSAYDLMLTMSHVVGNFLGVAVGGALVLWLVTARTRTLRLPVALAGGILLVSWIALTGLRLAANAAVGPAGAASPSVAYLAMALAAAVSTLAMAALLVLGVLLARRTRRTLRA